MSVNQAELQRVTRSAGDAPDSAHEDNFDEAVAASIAELTRSVDHHTSLLRALEDRLPQRD